MAAFQKFTFDEISSIPIEALLQSERDAGLDNDLTVAEQMEAEREAVRVLARAEGFEAGLKYAREQSNAKSEGLLEQLVAKLAVATGDIDAKLEALAAEAGALAFDFATAVAGRVGSDHLREELVETVRSTLKEAVLPPKLIIRVHPDDAGSVSSAVAAESSARGFEGRVAVVGDPQIVVGDGEIDWQTGSLKICRSDRLDAARRLVADLLPVAQ